MGFTPTLVDGSTTPIPMSSAVPDGTNTPLPIEGGPPVTTGGNTLVPVSLWIKDGNDVTQGTSTDANTANSVIGRLTKIRDLLNATLPVSVTNANANGQALMVASSPIAIASDQSPVRTRSDFAEVIGNAITASTSAAGATPVAGADLITQFDVSAYKFFSIQLAGTWAATFTFQGSNDNATWINVNVGSIGSSTSLNTTQTANGTYYAVISYRYLRIRCTAFTSNASLVGTAEFYTVAPPLLTAAVNAAQQGTWTVSTQAADLTLLASSAQTTTQTFADQSNPSARGIRVVLDMTVVGTGSVTLEIDAKDQASGKYIALLTGAAVTTNSTNVYIVHPDLTAVANSIAKDILPRTWRVKVVANNANSATYSVGASYLI